MKNIIKILVVALVSCQYAMAQTITKTASNNNPMLGEEFYYTVTMSNLNSFSDLNYVQDDLGLNLDYIGIEYGPALRNTMASVCGGINAAISNPTTTNTLIVDFSTCGAVVSGVSNFWFKIKVKLNAGACEKDDHSNDVLMNILNNNDVMSNVSTVTINKDDPYELEKVFRSYDSGELTYDIRLNSAYGDFGMLDFPNTPSPNTPKFSDKFKIPACLDMGANPINNIKVVYISDESTMTQQAVNYNVAQNGNLLHLGWDLPVSRSTNTSILYQVIIKIDDCACVNQLFDIENTANFIGYDRCGSLIKKNSASEIKDVACINNELDTPSEEDICFKKDVQIDDNGLTPNGFKIAMKGCTGKYIITVKNCSTRYVYNSVDVTDLLPPVTELEYGQPVVTTNNGTVTLIGTTLTASTTSTLSPYSTLLLPKDYSFTIEIPFKVVTNTPELQIDNCATVDVQGVNMVTNTPLVLDASDTKSCDSFKTVPNKVAVHTSKTICNPKIRTCGEESISGFVPGDTVEYALHFYNYGTAEGDDFFLEDILPANFKIANLNNDVKVFRKNSGNNENSCAAIAFNPIDNKVKKNYSPTSNKLTIDFKKEKLDEFTCKGVTHYLVKVKAKIDVGTPNGTYDNEFFVNYRDSSIGGRAIAASNIIPAVINVDNLVIAKKVKEEIIDVDGCENKTKKYRFTITLANMGEIPVFADIDDVLGSPAPANLLSYGDFKMCQSTVLGLCVPTTPLIPTSQTANSFNITGLVLKPCEVTVITYEAVFDINPLSKNQEVRVCNEVKLRTYVDTRSRGGRGNRSQIQPVVTSNQSLIQHYLDAPTSKEKLEIIELIKETKIKSNSNEKTNDSNSSNSNRSNRNINFDYGIEKLEACLDLKDCLPSKEIGCFTDSSSPFDFSILGMNRNGEITTSLINQDPLNKITQIEYLLTDVQHIKTCEDQYFYIRGKRYTSVCNGCSANITGPFITTSLAPIGSLNYISQLPFSGTYKESNNVEFKGQPTTVIQDNRTFRFPVSVNCNGTFEFTITAIVHFEDCSVCYVTDVFDYNASFRFTFPKPRPKLPLKPLKPFKP